MVTPGNINDMLMVEALFAAAGPFRQLVADRGYDTNRVRELITARGAVAVIPSTATRRPQIPYDKACYRSVSVVPAPSVSPVDTDGSLAWSMISARGNTPGCA